MEHLLGFDIGATKVAWGCFTSDGKPGVSGRFATPETSKELLITMAEICKEHNVTGVGIGMPGTLNTEHTGTRICTNLPQVSGVDMRTGLRENLSDESLVVRVDNDAR